MVIKDNTPIKYNYPGSGSNSQKVIFMYISMGHGVLWSWDAVYSYEDSAQC